MSIAPHIHRNGNGRVPSAAPLHETAATSGADWSVRRLQALLNQVLPVRLAVDGVAGPRTRLALRQFQRMRGLPESGIATAATWQALLATTPIDRVEAARTGVSIPDGQVAGRTLYAVINLGNRERDESPIAPLTGIFVPRGFRPTPELDLIIHLHGWMNTKPYQVTTYWNTQRSRLFPLREMLSASCKNAILVVPSLGSRSRAGWLGSPGGLERFVSAVLRELAVATGHPASGVRSISLSAHSGGGAVMRAMATHTGALSGLIREVWGFDCTYSQGDAAAWQAWATAGAGRQITIYARPDTSASTNTWREASKLQQAGLPNVTVVRTTVGHDDMVARYWPERLAGAHHLEEGTC